VIDAITADLTSPVRLSKVKTRFRNDFDPVLTRISSDSSIPQPEGFIQGVVK
jgi:hypothetical protein